MLTLILCSFLFFESWAQDLGQTSEGFTTTQAIDWDSNGKDVLRMESREIRQPRLTSYYDLPFGLRIQQQNMSGPAQVVHPRFTSPIEPYSVNWTDYAEPFPQPSEEVKYPLPPFIYYPQTDMMNYPQPEDFANLQNSASRHSRQRNVPPPLPAYPEATRLERTRQFPVPFGIIPDSDYFLRRDIGVANTGNMLPYHIPPEILFPFAPNSGEDKPPYQGNNIFERPPYYDREPGSEDVENVPPHENISLSSLATEPSIISAEARPVEVPAPLEPVSARTIPRRPFPVGAFPYGFSRRDSIPPFQLPPGVLPPVIPPPTLPPQLPIDENLFARVVSGTTPPTFADPIVSDTLPPKPAIIPEDSELGPAVSNLPREDIEINARIPYEFGYEMNDGRGTDQHRKESGDGTGAVTGSYGYKDPDGVYRLVNYVADKNGFRATIQTNEPGVANPGSADVIVRAERPPLKTIEEGLKLGVEEIPDDPLDIASETIIRK